MDVQRSHLVDDFFYTAPILCLKSHDIREDNTLHQKSKLIIFILAYKR